MQEAQQAPRAESAEPTEHPREEPVEEEAPSIAICADRGSFSDGALITPGLAAHLELGYTFTYRRDGPDEIERHTGPETLLRIGMVDDRLEFRAIWSGWTWTELETLGGDEDHDRGASDLIVGGKLKLTDQAGMLPTTSLIAQTTVGAGSEGFSTQEVDPIFKLIWAYDLGSGFGLLGNGNLALVSDGEGRFAQWQASLCPSYTPTPGTTVFGEYFFLAPATRRTDAAHSVDFGVLQLITDRIQIDVRAGFGLNDEADDFFTGAGVSFLFGPPGTKD